jgi:hypothetical protein
MTDSSQTPTPPLPAPAEWSGTTCLGRTCLQWSEDGELTSVDLLLGRVPLRGVKPEARMP